MVLDSAPDAIARLMAAFRAGDSRAGGQLMELFYPELKRLAARHLNRERHGHSLQPTLLVNELYLQLIKIKALQPRPDRDSKNEKAAFFALAGQIMKRLLIHHSRRISSKAQKIRVVGRSPRRGRLQHPGSRRPAFPAGRHQTGNSHRGRDESVRGPDGGGDRSETGMLGGYGASLLAVRAALAAEGMGKLESAGPEYVPCGKERSRVANV